MKIAFRPKLLDCLPGYNRAQFGKDLASGITVGVLALPLAMAFAIASGVSPTAGIWMPAPNARMADVAKRIQMERCPAKNSRTSTKVESAMMPSERTIRRFRL
mgnify:CR=1 FL=1